MRRFSIYLLMFVFTLGFATSCTNDTAQEDTELFADDKDDEEDKDGNG